jgi:hypothetical protein
MSFFSKFLLLSATGERKGIKKKPSIDDLPFNSEVSFELVDYDKEVFFSSDNLFEQVLSWQKIIFFLFRSSRWLLPMRVSHFM